MDEQASSQPSGAFAKRASLSSQTALATALVALLAVLLTGLVALRLVPQAAERQARDTLGVYADLVATSFERAEAESRPGQPRLARLGQALRRQQITVVLLRPGRSTPGVVTSADVGALALGQDLSAVRDDPEGAGGGRLLLEGRPVGDGGGVVLLQPADAIRDSAGNARQPLLLSMLIGLAGAALAGLLLARRLNRPLRQAARAAHRLSTGARDVRIEPEGPQEVAEVAEAINVLSSALATSEGRQREFLLSISHELRTPLTAVVGYAEAMSDGVVRAEDVRPTGAVLLGEARRLERLVSDLLDLARLGAQDFRLDLAEVDLDDLVRRAGTVWEARCERQGVHLRLEIPHRPVLVRTDATRVRQILDGLAENALRVAPEGSTVVLALSVGADEVLLQVRDGGPGLTPDDLEVAFERSALYDRYRGIRRVGTGVGLALVAGLARRLGGGATAGTAPEGGAAFTVRLPLSSYTTRTLP